MFFPYFDPILKRKSKGRQKNPRASFLLFSDKTKCTIEFWIYILTLFLFTKIKQPDTLNEMKILHSGCKIFSGFPSNEWSVNPIKEQGWKKVINLDDQGKAEPYT
jgi:hypothetical protein